VVSNSAWAWRVAGPIGSVVGATIDLVVERAGASKATVYSFFGGKDGLFAAMVEERCERILSAFGDPEVVDSNVPSALTHIARRYMEVVLAPDAVGLYRMIIAEGVRFPELTRTFFQIGRTAHTIISGNRAGGEDPRRRR
jgi:AcrR family transcriptional regulator